MSDTLSLSKGEWKEYKLGDVIEFGNGRVRPKSSGNIPVYGGNGILDYCNESNYDSETIIIGRVGAYCGSIYYENKPIWVSDNALAAKPKENFQAKFLFYFLKNLGLNQLAEGSSHPLVTQTLLNSIDVFITDNFNEQHAIASILSSIDDKIDLLHLQNKTLEQLAETLFRQWFVLNEHEDWEEKSLDQIADYLNGLACQKYPPLDEINKLPVIKIKDIKNGFSDNSDWVTSEVPKKYIIERGDILFSWSGSLEVMIWAYGKGVLNQHLFKVTSVEYPKWLYYFATKLHLDDFRVIAESKSTTMGHIQREHLSAAKIKIPNAEDILKQMDNTFSPLINKIIINFDQIDLLTKMRDTLLPKLMSGEIRVRA